jgi:hypothetical protein
MHRSIYSLIFLQIDQQKLRYIIYLRNYLDIFFDHGRLYTKKTSND